MFNYKKVKSLEEKLELEVLHSQRARKDTLSYIDLLLRFLKVSDLCVQGQFTWYTFQTHVEKLEAEAQEKLEMHKLEKRLKRLKDDFSNG